MWKMNISQNQTEVKDGDRFDIRRQRGKILKMKELIRPKMIQKLREDPSEVKKRQKFLLKKNSESIEAEVEENPEQELEQDAEMERRRSFHG